jgi:NAD+ synthase
MAAEQTQADHQVIAGAVVMKSIGHQEGVAGDRLRLNAEEAVSRIAAALREQLGTQLKRWGFVVAMSGGIDSSTCAALAVQAVGAKRVVGLFLPERDSDPVSLTLATELATQLGIEHVTEDIAPILTAAGCYARRDEAIRRAVPEYGEGWKCKLALPTGRGGNDRLNVTQLVVQNPAGERWSVRLGSAEYRQIVAATNFKQRVRKMMEYYHADRLHYAVVGTPNRLEYDQGFFVKGGDGLADVKPIAHLFKTQVYQLAEHLGVPKGISSRPPTTDTFSLPQSQEEFYFSFPARTLDQVLHARNAGLSAAETARETGLTEDQVAWGFRDIAQKRATTRYLHLHSLTVEPVLLPQGGEDPS